MVAINENNYSEDRIRVFQFGYLATALASFNMSGSDQIVKIFHECDPVLRKQILDDPETISFREACEIAFQFNISALKMLGVKSEDFKTDKLDMKFSVERATVIRIADRMHHTKDGDPLLCDLKSIIVNASSELLNFVLDEPFLFTDDHCKLCLDRGLTYNKIFEVQVDNAE
ncbi:MAG: hypothetical protein ACPHAR_03575 [Flavobacteriaceae bacterium]